MKRIIALIAAAALCLSGCHSMIDDERREIVIYASFYPVYSFLSAVTEGAPLLKVECLTQPIAGCLRSYELSYWDIAKLSLADAVFIGGRGLESFEDVLSGASFAVVEVMQAMELIGEDDEVPDGDDEASHFAGANPWAWLSADKAREMCESIRAAMVQLDPMYENVYTENMEKVAGKFDELDAYIAGVMPKDEHSIAVMHEGLAYLANELGLDTVCAIERESGMDMDDKSLAEAVESIKASGAEAVLIEKQASAALVKKLDAEGLNVILVDTFAYSSHRDYFTTMKDNALAVAGALQGGNGGY